MATTTGASLFDPIEKENPTPTAKEESPKKAEATVSTTTEVARVVPLEDENLTMVVEDTPKKVKTLTKEEGEEEEHKKIMVGGQEEDMELKVKGVVFGCLEAKNDEALGEGGENDNGDMDEEEDAKGGSLQEETMKDDSGRELAAQDKQVVIDVVEVAPALEFKSKNIELWAEDTAMVSPDAPKGVDKCKLQVGRREEEVGAEVEEKVVNKLVVDGKSIVVEEKKLEPGGSEQEKVGYEGGDGGELGKEKEVDHSIISVEATEDKEAPFAKANDELDCDIVVMEGEETLKESTKKDGVEDGIAKPKPMSDASTMVNPQSSFVDNDVDATRIAYNSINAPIQFVHDGSAKEVDPTSEDFVLEYSLAKEQDVEGQIITSEAMKVVGVKKPLEVENIDARIEDIGVDEPTVIENVTDIAKGIDVEKPMEVENIAGCSRESILSQELALESREENNDPEDDEYAIEVVEDEATKSEPMRDASTMVVHDGSIEEVDLASVDNVLDDSPWKEQNDKNHATRSEALKYVGVEKSLHVENLDVAIEDNGVEKSIEVENVDVVVEGINVEKPTKVENIDGMLSQELVPESSKENNDEKEDEYAIEVVYHEYHINVDDTFEAMTNVKEVENDEAESDGGGDDGGELEEAIEDAKGGVLGAVEAVKDDGRRELVVRGIKVDISMVEPTPTLITEPKLGNGEFGEEEEEDVMTSSDTLKGEDSGELMEEEVGTVVEAKVTEVVEKPEPEGERSENIGYRGGNGDELGKENEIEIPVVSVVAAELEDLLAPFAKAKCELAVENEENNEMLALGGEQATKESTEKDVDVEHDIDKPKPTCEASIVVAHDRSVKEVDSANPDSMLAGNPGKEQNIKGLTTTTKALEDVGVEKLIEVKNILATMEGIDVDKATEGENIAVVEGIDVKPYPTSKTSIVVVHDGSLKEVDLASDSVLEDSSRTEQNVEGFATSSEAVEDVGVEKHLEVEDNAIMLEDLSVEKTTKIGNVVVTEGDDVKHEPESKIMHDRSEVDPASEDNVIKDSPRKEQNAEGLVATSEVMVDVGINKNLEVENIVAAIEDNGVDKSTKIEDVALENIDGKPVEPTSEASIIVVHDGSIKEVDQGVDTMLDDSPQKEQNVGGLAVASEVMEDVGVEKLLEVENLILAVDDIGVEKPTEIENVVAVEHTDFKLEPTSEVVCDGSVKEVDPTSGNRVLDDSPWKKQNVEGLVTTSEVEEDVGVEKHLEVKNIAIVIEDIGVDNSIEIENVVEVEGVDVKPEPASEASIVIVHGGSVKEFDPASGDSVLNDSPWKEWDSEGLASASEAVENLCVEKPLEVENIAATVEDISIVKPKIGNIVPREGVDVKSESACEVVNDGSINEVYPASVNRVLEDSPWKDQNVEDMVTTSEVVEEFVIRKPLDVKNITTIVEDIGVEKSTEIENIVVVEGVDVKTEPASEIVHDGSVKEVDPAGGDNVLKDSPWKEQDVEGPTSASDVVEDFDVKKPLENENIAATVEYIGVVKPTEIENIVPIEGVGVKPESASEASIVVVHDGSINEVYPASIDRVLENSPWKEQNIKRMVTTCEVVEEVDIEKPLEMKKVTTIVEDIGMEKSIEIENVVVVEGVDVKHELASEIVHDESVKEVDPASGDSVLKDSPWKEQDVEGLARASDAVEDFDAKKPLEVENNAATVDYIGVVKPTEIENIVPIEGVDVKPKSSSESSIVVVDDGSVNEVYPASVDRVVKDSLRKKQNVEGMVTTSEVVEEVDFGKPLEVKNIATILKDIGMEKSIEIENVVAVEGVDVKHEIASEIVHDESLKKVDPAGRDSVLDDSTWKEQNDERSANASETVEDFGVEKPLEVENIVDVIEDIGVVKPIDIENVVPVEGIDVKHKSASEASTVVVHDGSIKEFDPVGANSVLEDIHGKEQNIEGLATTSEVVEDVDMFLEDKNINVAVKDIGIEKPIDIGNVATIVEVIDAEKPMEVEIVVASSDDGILSGELALESCNENNYPKETEGDIENFDQEEEVDGDDLIEVVIDDEDGVGIEANENVGGANYNTSSTWVATLKGDEATKQIMKELVEASSSGDMCGLRDFTNSMGGHIMLDDPEEDDGDYNRDKGFDYATLAPIGGPSYENMIFSSQDGSGTLNMDRAAGLGSSSPSLRPTAPHQPIGSNLFNTSELALTAYPTEEMNEEESKLHDKVELIRIKFLRLVYRLGATLGETVATQVLYRLSLAEGINHGRQTTRAFSLDDAWRKALILEAEGKEDLNFSCNILVLGKTGVGKSATINSIFGEAKLKTDAFSSATTSMREIIGYVHGVKIRIIDTPGLRPSVMDQGSNRKILAAVKKYTKKCPPDIVLYVDRLDYLSCDLSDLPHLKTITAILGPSIWFDAIVALTHADSTPPEGLNGAPMTYDVIMAQSTHIIQQSIRQAVGDMRLVNPVVLVENHPSCRRNSAGQKVLPNGKSWRDQMLLLCYSSKILYEANSLLKLQDPNHEKLFGFRFNSLALHFMLSSLLQTRAHPELLVKHGGNEGNSDVELDYYSYVEQAIDEEEYDQLDMVLPPSFDCDNPTYRYRFPEPTSIALARPLLDAHGWDHDCGYDGISVEETLAILNRFPTNLEVQVTKKKKEFSIHLDSSIATKHGENASTLAGFDIQTIGRHLVYILRGETKIKSIKKNRATGGVLVTFLGDIVAAGLKVEDQLSLGKRLSLVARTGAMRVQGDTAYGANLEARLKEKDCPIGQLSILGLSLIKWRQDLTLGANLQSQFSIGMGSKMALHLGLNNKLSGQISVKTSTSEQVQIALLGLMPVAASIYRSFQPKEP